MVSCAAATRGLDGGVGEPQACESDLGDDVQRVGRLDRRRGVQGAKAVEGVAGVAAAVADAVAHGARDRVLPRRRRVAHELQQIGDRELLAQLVQPDRQRVKAALLLGAARELQHPQPTLNRGEVGPAVVGLGIEVNDQAAATQRLVGDELRGERLARSQRPGQQHAAGPRLARWRGHVIQHRPPHTGRRVAEVGAARVADPGGGRGDHGGELLGGELLDVVAHPPAVGARKVIKEQPLLKPARPVELDVAVAGAQRLDA